jgi:hypothetical protein
MRYYMLDENNNVLPCTLSQWSDFFGVSAEHYRKTVGFTIINNLEISTIFLALDLDPQSSRSFLFETRVCNEEGEDVYCKRYSTWADAEEGHQKAIKWVNEEGSIYNIKCLNVESKNGLG